MNWTSGKQAYVIGLKPVLKKMRKYFIIQRIRWRKESYVPKYTKKSEIQCNFH